jgi:hypothetical protein
MSNYKLCPKCGELATLNLYFRAYMCDSCGWRDHQVEDSSKMPIDDNNSKPHSDMTLRDKFAMKAMEVLLTNEPHRPLAEVGKSAYILADSMIKERKEELDKDVSKPQFTVTPQKLDPIIDVSFYDDDD